MLRKISVSDLRVDMFIAELDRPWIDTPFPLQGFMIVSEAQLRQLQQVCKWVMVDPERSIGREYEAPPKVAPPERRELGITILKQPSKVAPLERRDPGNAILNQPTRGSESSTPPATVRPAKAPTRSAPEQPVARLRASAPPAAENRASMLAPPPARREARRSQIESGGLLALFGQLKNSAKSMFASRQAEKFTDDAVSSVQTAATPQPRPEFISNNVVLTIYDDDQSVEEELGFASESYERTNEILARVTEDIRAGNTLQLHSVEDVIDDMVDSMVRNPDAMMWVARMRELDHSTYDHGLSVAINLVAFGRHLGYPRDPLSHLGMVGLLLDIGKIKLPRTLLEKSGRLTESEFALAKTHVALGLNELHRTPNIHPDVLEGIAQHHERMNGSGYPQGLQGEKISVFGRMAGIADTYAAMTKKRAYAAAASPHEVLQMLSNWSGSLYQGEMVEQFIQSIGAFPVGSMVELSSGEVGVIVTHNKHKRLKPKVLIITEADKKPRKYPTTIDLIYDVSEKPVYIRRGLPNDAYGLDPTEFYLS